MVIGGMGRGERGYYTHHATADDLDMCPVKFTERRDKGWK